MREVGELTDRQISSIHFHARDKQGSLKAPTRALDKKRLKKQMTPAKSLEAELLGVEPLRALLSAVDFEKMIQEINSRWVNGERNGQQAGDGSGQASPVSG